jgi:hypothetical protein
MCRVSHGGEAAHSGAFDLGYQSGLVDSLGDGGCR